MPTLVLPPDLRAEIERAAVAAFSRECCGLIEGIARADIIEAHALHPARNLASAPDRFEIDPADHIKAQRAARNRGRAIIGCYHSHPNGVAEPSVHDRSGARETGFVWLIAALAAGAPPTLKAFIFNGECFESASLDSPNRARV